MPGTRKLLKSCKSFMTTLGQEEIALSPWQYFHVNISFRYFLSLSASSVIVISNYANRDT